MRAGAEAEVVVGVAVEDGLVGPVEGLRVPVARRPQEEHPIPRPERAAAERGVPGHRAPQALDGRGQAHELLHRGVEQVGVGQQAGPIGGVVGEVGQGQGDGAGGGVEPAEEEQHHREQLLVVVEGPAVDLTLEEHADEVVCLGGGW